MITNDLLAFNEDDVSVYTGQINGKEFLYMEEAVKRQWHGVWGSTENTHEQSKREAQSQEVKAYRMGEALF